MRKVHLQKESGHLSADTGMWAGASTVLRHAGSFTYTSTQQVAMAQNPLIMVIDDSATVRKIVETCLGREGFHVKCFPDGIEAMKWLMKPEACIPQLIILDIGLPKMDGYEVARSFKAQPQFEQTVIIMLSRRDSMIDKLKGRLAGAREYLIKPFQTQHLVSVVEAHLRNPIM